MNVMRYAETVTFGESALNPKEYTTLEELEGGLMLAGVDISVWGTGSAKTTAHLLRELELGESVISLAQKGGVRAVRVAWVDVLYADKDGNTFMLFEDRQEYRDGRMRRRTLNSSLGEKLKKDEDPDAAAIRALDEELGVSTVKSMHMFGYDHTNQASESYPGLVSIYGTYKYAAILDETSFNPDGYVEEQSDKVNYYVWGLIHPADA